MSKFDPCPCFSGQLYHKCCRPYHLGEAAPDAEKLMRSRYCAYALGLSDYIMATTDSQGPLFESDTASWRRSIDNFSKQMRFIGLKIHEFVDSEPAYVTFTASLIQRQGEKDQSFTEKSRFSKHDGRWFYVEPV